MQILLTNDDGITANGIRKLAEIALKITDDVYIVAPDRQRSAVSHSFTIPTPIRVKKIDYPLPVKAAYSCSGTPADCVKVALNALLSSRPDCILSGINRGYNMGYDTVYSGTVAAAREGAYYGIPSAAVSTEEEDYTYVDRHLEELIRILFLGKEPDQFSGDFLKDPLHQKEFWNINFPSVHPSDCLGVKETTVADYSFYLDTYAGICVGENEWEYRLTDEICQKKDPDSDFVAVENGYISVEKLFYQ